jgi:hypothetical protein
MPQKCIEGSCRKRPLSVETVRKYLAERWLTEREELLLRAWGDLADLVLHRRGRLTSPHHQEHAGRTETLRLLGYRFGGQLARTPPRPSRRRPPVQMIACVPPNQTGSAGWSEGHNNSAPLTKRRTSLRLLPSPWGYSPQLFGGWWHCSIIASIASPSTAI